MQRFFGVSIVIMVLLLIAGHGVAAPCNDCHTIHNSQDGIPMRFDNGAQPLPLLLRGGCIECHTGLNTLATIDRPKVYSTSAPTYIWGNTTAAAYTTLAGGSFYYVNNSDFFGHNVRENAVAGADPRGDIPPGGVALPPDGNPSPLLQCAGNNGCHGDAAVSPIPLNSLDGAHHINETGVAIDGSTVAKSYRFLKGVLGWEDDDWEFTSSSTDHNRYVGQDRTLVSEVSAAGISGFCASCHQNFHNTSIPGARVGIGYNNTFASPWLRHPNDYDLPLADLYGEYASYTTYNTKAPLARTAAALDLGTNDAVGNDQRIIMCLTCHRAHGSPYYASLRWNYRAWPGNDPDSGTPHDGCQICHTSKN